MAEHNTTTPMLTSRFQQAFAAAGELRATQVRKGTAVPYLAHLMSVAALVLEHGGAEDTAIAALLHDAVEDSDDGAAVAERIRAEFGDRVHDIVMGCSDATAVPGRPKPPWRERKAAYIDRLTRENDADVLLVSACDKLHNARSIVADLRSIGPAAWDRFSQPDPQSQLWYYKSLAHCYHDRVPPVLADEIDRVVAEMSSLASP
jgi:(p)ppGpp synthase/HD superfamily hydrolase